MRAARDLKQIVSDCVQGDVCLTVCNKNTNATVQLKASCKTVARSSYIRAAARFSSDSSGGCVGHVTILVDCKSAWCPEEALYFLETGRLNPTVWNSQRRLLVLLEFAGKSWLTSEWKALAVSNPNCGIRDGFQTLTLHACLGTHGRDGNLEVAFVIHTNSGSSKLQAS